MRETARLQGGAVTLGPLVFIAVSAAYEQNDGVLAGWTHTTTLTASLLLVVAGLLASWSRLLALALGTLAVIAAVVATAPVLTASPTLTLLCILLSSGLIARFWMFPHLRSPKTRPEIESAVCARIRATLASWVALACWYLVVVDQVATGVGPECMTAAAILIAWALSGAWLRSPVLHGKRVAWLVTLGLALLGIVSLLRAGDSRPALLVAAAPAIATLLLAPDATRRAQRARFWEPITSHPERLLIVTFLGMCSVATALLLLPICTTSSDGISLADAAFTAASAVCVTGLTVKDTAADFTGTGQLLILVAIQLGGLGIMTFSTAALGWLGRRVSIRQEGALADLLSGEDRGILRTAFRRTLYVTFVAEASGAVILAVLFASLGDGWGSALWRGVFTSVSAFCNAGFALQPDSLVSYRGDALVLHVIGALIVAGGLSPLAVVSFPRLLRGARLSLQLKLIYASSAFLLLFGFVMFAALEWNYSLAELSWLDRVHNAWFQSVTLRTAGFNSIDLAQTSSATRTLMMALMFIGGSPGGTAGGVKTVTVFILLLGALGALRGNWEAAIFGRRISHVAVYKAAAIATCGVLSVIVTLMALHLTQVMRPEVAIFEAISALGTVGLSLGGTALLDDAGKLIVMVAMFVGRVGPLTAFLFLSMRQPSVDLRPPEGEVEVG